MIMVGSLRKWINGSKRQSWRPTALSRLRPRVAWQVMPGRWTTGDPGNTARTPGEVDMDKCRNYMLRKVNWLYNTTQHDTLHCIALPHIYMQCIHYIHDIHDIHYIDYIDYIDYIHTLRFVSFRYATLRSVTLHYVTLRHTHRHRHKHTQTHVMWSIDLWPHLTNSWWIWPYNPIARLFSAVGRNCNGCIWHGEAVRVWSLGSTDFGAPLSLEPELPKQGVRRSSKELIPHPEILEATTMQYS